MNIFVIGYVRAKICSLSEFDKSDEEIGEMTNIKIGGCNIVLKAAGGKTIPSYSSSLTY